METKLAGKMVCPFIYNSSQFEGGNIKCITTKCMAWVDTTIEHKDTTFMTITERNFWIGEGWTVSHLNKDELVIIPKYRTGYCKRLGDV